MAINCISSASERPISTSIIATSTLTALALVAFGRFRPHHTNWAYKAALASGGVAALAITHRLLTDISPPQPRQEESLEDLLRRILDHEAITWPTTVEECAERINELELKQCESLTALWFVPPAIPGLPVLCNVQAHSLPANGPALERWFDINLLMSELALHQLELRYFEQEDTPAAIRDHLRTNITATEDLYLHSLAEGYRGLRCLRYRAIPENKGILADPEYSHSLKYNDELADPFYTAGTHQNAWRERYNAFCTKLQNFLPQPAFTDSTESFRLWRYCAFHTPDLPKDRASFKHNPAAI